MNRGNIEYDCKIYELLWIIKLKGVGGYFKIDPVDFLSAILISPIIKRNDQTSQWFSDDPIIGHDVIKCIINGRNFLWIMRYFHVCDMKNQVSREHQEYYPMFKARQFQKNPENHFNCFFLPGRCLILDKSLIHTFGRMEFKVRIIKIGP